MVTHTGKMDPQQQRRIENRAPRQQDDQDLVIREPGSRLEGSPAPSQQSTVPIPRREVNPAPSQWSTASAPRREEIPGPSQRSTVPTEEVSEPQVKVSRPPPRRRVAILVMGGTGTGKSSFIAEVTGERVQIGHDLHSSECTSWECRLDDQTTVTLVDTPGFNDTNRLDLEILKCITTYLTYLQEADIQLAGIIYMQRVTDRRMTGASFLNLQMFKAFCGEKYFPQVVFVTTMWNTIRDNNAAQQELLSRERELATTPEFWGDMIARGAKVKQFHRDRASGLGIVHLIYQQEHARRPRIMKELDQGYLLPDTEAGQVMTAEIRRQQRRREEEEIEEREEIELEAERLRRQQEVAPSSRSSRSTARIHTQRNPSTLPARGSQAGGADRRGPQRQPNINAVQAAQISYSTYYLGWPFKLGPS
ncbi:hypothetical protein N7493_005735 [Penicillium malachiteum]|uniref:G domain-containing protein n=1 Tax=Penicillium malachiteum TaxID=1324776 RepID=A0AAD6HN78_9EURO|nr:hypothetical protein N7493_005735 [Penicillium malachiteum]